MRYAQLVMGPAGSGKSTYCSAVSQHIENEKNSVIVVNLDPAAEHFEYTPTVDIRELIHIDDAMEDELLHFGPNGGLVFCMEYLIENQEWLKDQLGDDDDDYVIFDLPGQIELYTHMKTVKQLAELLQNWGFNVCSVMLIDSQFMVDGPKFISGTMAALSVMINLELPHINVLSKMDLLSKTARKHLDSYLEPDTRALLSDVKNNTTWGKKYRHLSNRIGQMIEDYSLVQFVPLNIKDENSISDLQLTINTMIQYGEDQDVRMTDFDQLDEDDTAEGAESYD
ncbi:GPN-loop GTPase,P-loop containing nucleoside triphosphate hydrolase [Cinara cedri]|uniref:GPN-loop GTPase 3 n=1 Tax=Cinara cedri TaxID=506608 RepID=A0A5E4NLD4_9HEMI|nr:GPN-loop GTPase,P-loop containing nucleoside triphosphate hydrolase [Cinara cedri]